MRNANRFARMIGRINFVTDGTGGTGGTGGSEQPAIKPEDFAALKTQLEAANGEIEKFKLKNIESEKHRNEALANAKKSNEDVLRKNGDVAALEISWKEKLDASAAERDLVVNNQNSLITRLTVGSAATMIAAKIAVEGSASVLLPHIQARLSMEMKDGEPVIKVLVGGKPSALTLADLEKEISESAAFAPIIRGSSASGSGDTGRKADGAKTLNRAAFDGLSALNRASFVKSGGKVVD